MWYSGSTSDHRIPNSDQGESSPSRDYHSDYSPLEVSISDNPVGLFTFTKGELLLEKVRRETGTREVFLRQR